MFSYRGAVLPSVAPGNAAYQLIRFLESLGSSNLYFHGLDMDMEYLLPFLERHRLYGGVWEDGDKHNKYPGVLTDGPPK